MISPEQLDIYTLLASYSEIPVHKHGSSEDSKNPKPYLALGIVPDRHPDTNAVSIFADGSVSFFTHDNSVIDQLRKEGYASEPMRADKPRNQSGHVFQKLSIMRIQQSEPIFRKLVADSVQIVSERYNSRKEVKKQNQSHA